MDKAKRISRGFHRLGLFLALIVFVALFVSAPDYDKDPLGNFRLIIEGLTAAFVYGVARFLGWVINGFLRTD